MNFQGFLEGILIDLRRLDFSEIVLDIDEIFVGEDGQEELLVVGEVGEAEGGCGEFGLRKIEHNYIFDRMIY